MNTGKSDPDGGALMNSDRTAKRIGIYDSRSVAVAFAGNDEHEARTAAELTALETAKASGDPLAIREAEDRVWESRIRLHRQAFGTMSVSDILDLYPDAVTSLKDDLKLSALISRWDKQCLAAYDGAEQIDVTEHLIDMLKPNDRQRQSAIGIQKHKPLTETALDKMIEQEREGRWRRLHPSACGASPVKPEAQACSGV
jgi:hypothetical protein